MKATALNLTERRSDTRPTRRRASFVGARVPKKGSISRNMIGARNQGLDAYRKMLADLIEKYPDTQAAEKAGRRRKRGRGATIDVVSGSVRITRGS